METVNLNITEIKGSPPAANSNGVRGSVVRGAYGDELYRFLKENGDFYAADTLVLSTADAFNIAIQPLHRYRLIVNLQKMNDTEQLCGFFSEVNKKMKTGDRYICCVETWTFRRQRILDRYPPVLNHFCYFGDYILKRVFRDLYMTRWFYNLVSRSNRAVDYYEGMGRLIYCGFRVDAERQIGGLLYFVATKVAEAPMNPREHYGSLLVMDKIGQNGNLVKVYKFRTMVPFSEFVQSHIYNNNHLRRGGKFMNDRRITRMGAMMRRFWIDEWPMMINLFKGEVKLVGVRPLSPQYLSLYAPDVARRRVQVKPGLVPPYYADLPRSLEEIQQSEINYIEKWEKAPYSTDVRYFFKAVWNIVVRGARSK